MIKKICYCHNFSEDDIINDVLMQSGHSLILEKIIQEKKNGTCECTTKHPESRCCIPDVHRVVNKTKRELAE